MEIPTPIPEYSQCGASESEVFHRSDYSGRRCLRCGHEAITQDRRPRRRDWPFGDNGSGGAIYQSGDTRPKF